MLSSLSCSQDLYLSEEDLVTGASLCLIAVWKMNLGVYEAENSSISPGKVITTI